MFLILIFVAIMLVGVPLLAVLGLSSVISILVDGTLPLTMIAQTMYTGVDQYPLIAVSLFMLAGALMEGARITEDIVNAASALFGNMTGGLAIVAFAACMFFAAISGSGPATAAAVGGMMIPGMVRRGYPADFAGAVTASGGTMGILIPPSNPMIIYGVVANVSIAKMFMAGILPGLFLGIMFSLTAYVTARFNGLRGTEQKLGAREKLRFIWVGKWSLLSPILILGSIYAGICTPVEAAELAVIYALVIGFFVHRTLTFKLVEKAFLSAALLTGTIIIIIGVALSFGRMLTLYKVPMIVADAVLNISSDPYAISFLIVGVLIIAGMFMDPLSMIIVLTPVFLPLILNVGINPIQFGVMFVLCGEIAFLTPPVGGTLFVAMKQANVRLEELCVAVLPFLAVLFTLITLIIFFPQICLILPNLVM